MVGIYFVFTGYNEQNFVYLKIVMMVRFVFMCMVADIPCLLVQLEIFGSFVGKLLCKFLYYHEAFRSALWCYLVAMCSLT